MSEKENLAKVVHKRAHVVCRGSSRSMHQSRSKSLTNYSQQINVSGFPLDTTQETVTQILSPYGTITDVQPFHGDQLPSHGSASFTVTFSSPSEARATMNALSKIKIGDRFLFGNFVIPVEKEPRASMTITIRRIPLSFSLDQIKQLFVRFGEIDSIEQTSVPDPLQRYWRCNIKYTTFDAASAAVSEMNGFTVQDSKSIIVRFRDEPGDSGESETSLRRHSRSSISSSDLFNAALSFGVCQQSLPKLPKHPM